MLLYAMKVSSEFWLSVRQGTAINRYFQLSCSAIRLRQCPKAGAQTITECDASLARLGVDYADLHQIHAAHGVVGSASQHPAGCKATFNL